MQQILLQGLGLNDFKNLISEVLDEKLANTTNKDSYISDTNYLSRKISFLTSQNLIYHLA